MANHEPEQPQITEETVLSTEAAGLTADPLAAAADATVLGQSPIRPAATAVPVPGLPLLQQSLYPPSPEGKRDAGNAIMCLA